MTYSEFTRLYVEAYKLLVNVACGGFVQLLTSKVAAVRAAPAGGSEKRKSEHKELPIIVFMYSGNTNTCISLQIIE